MEKDKCIIRTVSDDQLKQLSEIYKMAVSKDSESNILACSLFKSLFPKNSYFDATFGYFYNVSLINRDEIKIYYYKDDITRSIPLGTITLINIINNILNTEIYYVPKIDVL